MATDIDPRLVTAMLTQCEQIDVQVRVMQRIYDDQSGLQDRFAGAGILSAKVAGHFGVCGLAARASGRKTDVRVDHPYAPYHEVQVQVVSDDRGDVAARVAVRFNEIYESIRLIRTLLADLPDGHVVTPVEHEGSPSCGVGWIEGWRGDVFVALESRERRNHFTLPLP